jgi:hypothetical protein
MINLDVRADFRQIDRQLQPLTAKLRDRVVAAALNKTADKAKTEMKRQITGEFAIKASDVGGQLKVSRASAKGSMLVAELEAFSRRRGRRSRNVALFRARQTSRGVTVQIKRSGGRKLIKGAFIGNQGRTVFERVGKSRLPIKGVETIDVPQMFNMRRVNRAVVAKILRELPVEVERALKAALARGWK